MTELELLTAAREDYREYGYAVGTATDSKGNRCALGSLIRLAHRRGMAFAPYDIARQRLVAVAFQRYDKTIVAVNDDPQLGRNAVLDCYDTAIKECEEELTR